ncbi:hypothetical protein DDE05_11475 [Streptomyces cavourensis]|nr:hypothetical protein DDE05_11475 [Streptomyces cavourensis]
MGPDMMAIVEDVRILGALLILPAASVFKAWLRYRRAVVAERGCTARLRTALHDVGPSIARGDQRLRFGRGGP